MKAQDIKHVSNAYINEQDLTLFISSKNIQEIKKAYANIRVSRTAVQLRKLAEPQDCGNSKRTMWFWFARNGFVPIPEPPG